MDALIERKESVTKEIEKIINYFVRFINNGDSSLEVFDAVTFNDKLNKFVILTTIELKEIVDELALNGNNVEIYENMDTTFNTIYVIFKNIYDKKILLEKERHRIRESLEIYNEKK